MEKIEQSLRDMWNTIKHMNTGIIKVPERENWEKKVERIAEDIVAETVSYLMKNINLHIHEVHRHTQIHMNTQNQ